MSLVEKYHARVAELETLRGYCNDMLVALQTVGSKTPVNPLATLICDYCGKDFILEGGQFHGLPASAGVGKIENSFVLNHCTFVQETNGTFRAYHGWLHSGCGAKGEAQIAKAKEAHTVNLPPGWKVEVKEAGLDPMEVYSVLFSFDPGNGKNGPHGSRS